MRATPRSFGVPGSNLTLITNTDVAKLAMAASASSAAQKADLRAIFVNGRQPRDDVYCALCCEKIRQMYIRDIKTNLYYCDQPCYRGHVKFCELALARRATEVS